MTDLERAREILSLYPVETAQYAIADALAAVRQESVQAERERALEAARDGVRVAFAERRDQEFIEEHDVIASIEDAFASTLPLTPEEPT